MLKRLSKARKKQSLKDRMSKESPEDYGTPYRSSGDWSLSNLEEIRQTEGYDEDYSGDEDFYGDDEENQSGYGSYTGEQRNYIGRGDWVDRRYGENKYARNHDPQSPQYLDGIRPDSRSSRRGKKTSPGIHLKRR